MKIASSSPVRKLSSLFALLLSLALLLPAAPPSVRPAAAQELAAPPAPGRLAPPLGLPGNENWSAYGSVGVSSFVRALLIDANGDLIVGGQFTTAGGITVNYVARWDNNLGGWSPLGSGMNGTVYALAMDAQGRIIAGGDFTVAGGVAANRIAIWDGNSWSPLGSGMNSTVRALAVAPNGHIYAGGAFNSPASFIARWDGTSWNPVGGGTNNQVYALAVAPDGSLYAGGAFTSPVNYLARWDGSTWSALGSGVSGPVNALVRSGSQLYAGGSFITAGGSTANRVARWDGSAWSVLGSGVNAVVHALAVDSLGNLYAGGEFTTAGGSTANRVARWDGSTWSSLGTGLGNGVSSSVYALRTTSNNQLFVGGAFGQAGGINVSYLARWDGLTWRPVGGGLNDQVFALAFSPTGEALYLGGEFGQAGGIGVGYVARWQDGTWSPLSLGTYKGVNNVVRALAVAPNGDLYVGGLFTETDSTKANRVARWDGSTWSALGSLGSNGVNNTVYALATDNSGNLYVGGAFTIAGGSAAYYIARWDGSNWYTLGTGMNQVVYALAVDSSGGLYAAGSFTSAGGTPAAYIARWDGSSWSALGSGLNGTAYALAIDSQGRVYVGGLFTTAGGAPANRVARWDPAISTWSALGSGVNGPVNALAIDTAGYVYVGGGFNDAGLRIARWNPVAASWGAMGSGADAVVNALAVPAQAGGSINSGELYVGGDFNNIGSLVTQKLGRWTAGAGRCGLSGGSTTFYGGKLTVQTAFSSLGTLDCLAMQRFNKNHPNATPDLLTGYYWELRGADAAGGLPSGYNLTLTLPTRFYADSGDGVCRYLGSGTNWSCGYTSHSTNSVTRSGITTLSDWAVSNNAPTAVLLFNFEAQPEVGGVHLRWETGFEGWLLGFNLYRSEDPLASIEQAVKVNSALILPHSLSGLPGGYEFFDPTAQPGRQYTYWLEALSLDGNQIFGPQQAWSLYGFYLPLVRR